MSTDFIQDPGRLRAPEDEPGYWLNHGPERADEDEDAAAYLEEAERLERWAEEDEAFWTAVSGGDFDG
jgi:hypothetical protein